MVVEYRLAAAARRPLATTETINHEGGIAHTVTPWTRLERFLILGSDAGSYYCTPAELTADNATAVIDAIAEDGPRVVRAIEDVSVHGKAPKQDPALLALALCAALGDEATKRAAYAAVPAVCRTGWAILHWTGYRASLGGWGNGFKRAVGTWFTHRHPEALAYQAIKYPSRDRWSQADLLRLAHPTPPSPSHDALFKWIVDGVVPEDDPALAQVEAASRLNGATIPEAAKLIADHRLPREVVPSTMLDEPVIWEALLPSMPLGATIRNLGKMTRVGLIAPDSAALATVRDRITDAVGLKRARIHPLALLAAHTVYDQGHGERGHLTWYPVKALTVALDEAFYLALRTVPPSGVRLRLAIDVSSSMDGNKIAGMPYLTAREVACAMALVTANVEPRVSMVAFSHELVPFAVKPHWRLPEVLRYARSLPFGGTLCSLPVSTAVAQAEDLDAFVTYTDSETGDYSWRYGAAAATGTMAEWLGRYRQQVGHRVRSVVCGVTANAISLADPADADSLDVVGFSLDAPALIGSFAGGTLGLAGPGLAQDED